MNELFQSEDLPVVGWKVFFDDGVSAAVLSARLFAVAFGEFDVTEPPITQRQVWVFGAEMFHIDFDGMLDVAPCLHIVAHPLEYGG